MLFACGLAYSVYFRELNCTTVDISGWLLTLTVMLLRFTHVLARVGSSLLLKNCPFEVIKVPRDTIFFNVNDTQTMTIAIILYLRVHGFASCFPADPQLALQPPSSSVGTSSALLPFLKTPACYPP